MTPSDDASVTRPLVTVVVPAFNAEQTIGATLSGALSQTWQNLEIVVVDDGSSDATADIVRAHRDPRIRLVRHAVNRGLPAARNTAIAEAQGAYITLCDSDDVLLPMHVEAAMNLLRPWGAGARVLVTSNSYLLTPAGVSSDRTLLRERHPRPDRQRATLLQSNFLAVMVTAPRSLYDQVGGFTPELSFGEDWDMWLRAVFAGWTVVRQPEPHALYRWTGASLSSRGNQLDEAEKTVLRRFAAEFGDGLSRQERSYLSTRLSSDSPVALAAQGDDHLRAGDYRLAARGYAQAARLVPAQRRVVAKAVLAQFPGVRRLLRWRLGEVDRRTGYHDGMRR